MECWKCFIEMPKKNSWCHICETRTKASILMHRRTDDYKWNLEDLFKSKVLKDMFCIFIASLHKIYRRNIHDKKSEQLEHQKTNVKQFCWLEKLCSGQWKIIKHFMKKSRLIKEGYAGHKSCDMVAVTGEECLQLIYPFTPPQLYFTFIDYKIFNTNQRV